MIWILYDFITWFIITFLSIQAGNIVTSFYYRLPRGITVNGRKSPPMCSSCGVKLSRFDFGPIYYLPFKNKSCKSCGAKFLKKYLWIEIILPILLILNFIRTGINQSSAIEALCIIMLFLNLAIYIKHKFFCKDTFYLLALSLTLYAFAINKTSIDILFFDHLIWQIASIIISVIFFNSKYIKPKHKPTEFEYSFCLLFPLIYPSPILNFLATFAFLISTRRFNIKNKIK